MAAKKAKKPQSPAMEFLVDSLKKNKKAVYGDLKAAAQERGLTVHPIMFGRAQALLGIVKSAKRGQGKTAKKNKKKTGAKPGRPAGSPAGSKSAQVRELLARGMSAAEIAKQVGCTLGLVYNVKSTSGRTKKRGPGRPPKAATTNGLGDIVAVIKSSENQRAEFRSALERIQAVIADVLA